MKSTTKIFVALVLSAGLLGGTQAVAQDRSSDRNSNRDREYQESYDRGSYDRNDRDYRDSNYRDSNYRDRNDRRRARSRVVKKRTFNTRYRASVRLVEEVYYTRSGREQLVCTVLARGPEAGYVSRGRLKKVAKRNCSRYARIQFRSNYYRSSY